MVKSELSFSENEHLLTLCRLTILNVSNLQLFQNRWLVFSSFVVTFLAST